MRCHVVATVRHDGGSHACNVCRGSMRSNATFQVWTDALTWLGYFCKRCLATVNAIYDYYLEVERSEYTFVYYDLVFAKRFHDGCIPRLTKI